MDRNKSRTGLKNTDVIVAKCANPNCGWEVQAKEEIDADAVGGISCPMCGEVMAWEIN